MEFEEMRKIWDVQNEEPLYAINEKALHNFIHKKKMQAGHVTHFTEVLLIGVNVAMGAFIFAINFLSTNGNVSLYILSVWTWIIAGYILINRLRRIKGSKKFDRSIRSDLYHAISTASYQVRISQLMRWNILPTAILTLFGIWEGGKSIWVAAGILIVFVLAHFASGWEHNIYKSRKRDLEILKSKLGGE